MTLGRVTAPDQAPAPGPAALPYRETSLALAGPITAAP